MTLLILFPFTDLLIYWVWGGEILGNSNPLWHRSQEQVRSLCDPSAETAQKGFSALPPLPRNAYWTSPKTTALWKAFYIIYCLIHHYITISIIGLHHGIACCCPHKFSAHFRSDASVEFLFDYLEQDINLFGNKIILVSIDTHPSISISSNGNDRLRPTSAQTQAWIDATEQAFLAGRFQSPESAERPSRWPCMAERTFYRARFEWRDCLDLYSPSWPIASVPQRNGGREWKLEWVHCQG